MDSEQNRKYISYLHLMVMGNLQAQYWQQSLTFFFLLFCYQWLQIHFLQIMFSINLYISQVQAQFEEITHYGLVMPYGTVDLGQDWLR